MNKELQIAIDGPSSSGKSTIAKRLAQKLHYIYLDTGAMYRAVTLKALEEGIQVSDEAHLNRLLNEVDIRFLPSETGQCVFVDGVDVTHAIRSDKVSRAVSGYSALAYVRQKMVEKQQKIAHAAHGIIMDGRDIGTVVLPHADLKIYLTASAAKRAQRRFLENQEKGYSNLSLEELELDIIRRDTYDSNRKESPLVQADDALLIDSSDLTLEAVEQQILNEINKIQSSIQKELS